VSGRGENLIEPPAGRSVVPFVAVVGRDRHELQVAAGIKVCSAWIAPRTSATSRRAATLSMLQAASNDTALAGSVIMLKVWGRKTSSNVQKVIWALAELKIPFERIDAGLAFGRTKEPFYLAMNPNSLVPTLEEEDGFTLWESNSIIRYLAAKHAARVLEPAEAKVRARAQMWMDWQLSVMGPAITPVFWQLIRTPADKRDQSVIAASREKTVAAAAIMDAQLGRTTYLAGDAFSYGDIPLGIMIYRYMQLIAERPPTPNLDRWYAAIAARPAFKEQVASVPLS
jgi:glutathione S-transferase